MASQDIHGLHHFHKRKRVHQKLEKYPHPNKWKRLMDRLIYVVAFVSPVMTIPQIYAIWIMQNASGVSIASWLTYTISAIFWLIYALMHKEKPLIFSSALWVFMDVAVVVGVLIY